MADWWDDNGSGSGDLPTNTDWLHDAVAAAYQAALGRAASEQEINGWISGTGGNLAAIQQGIYGSQEATNYKAAQAAKGPTTQAGGIEAAQAAAAAAANPQTAAASGGRMDDNAILAQIAKWAAMPGADPSLGNDPNYWLGAIKSRGGLGPDNTQYWQDASVGPTAFFNNPNRESGNTASTAAPLNQIGNAPAATTYQAQSAPAYNPYNPGPAPKPTPFVAPTLEDARNSPGFQSAIENADQGIQRSALAKSGLSGGLLKDISAYNIGLADQNYQNVFGNALSANQANNGQALNAYSAEANANIGAGNLNLAGTNSQFQNTYQPSWNAYLSNVGQQQFGANYGLQANQQQFGQGLANRQFDLSAQNQYWGQGFQENQNAYNQYDNSQKTAFDQWYKLMQAGNPGNPYT